MRSVDEKRGEVKGLTEVVGFGDAVVVCGQRGADAILGRLNRLANDLPTPKNFSRESIHQLSRLVDEFEPIAHAEKEETACSL
jgi:hypothetical protein